MSDMILKLTDGTTTLDLNDLTNYAIPYNEWTPAVATRRRNQLGGALFNDVEETIPLHVRGATAPAALANVQALTTLLDQAERFANGANVDAVRIQYKPTNSSLTNPVEAVVLGGSRRGILKLSPRINDAGNYEIDGVSLKLLRRGLWLADEASDTVSSAVSVGNAITWTFGSSASLPTPHRFVLTAANVDSGGADIRGYLLFSELSTNYEIVEAESVISSGAASSSRSIARGGAIADSTADTVSFYIPVTAADVRNADRIGLLFTGRIVDDWSYEIGIIDSVMASNYEYDTPSRSGALPENDTVDAYFIGPIPTNSNEINYLRITFTSAQTKAASLKIDYFVLFNYDRTQTIFLSDDRYAALISAICTIDINPKSLTGLQPDVRFKHTTGARGGLISYRGNAQINLAGSTAIMIPVLVRGASANDWRFGISIAVAEFTGTAYRRPGYLTVP